MQRATTRIPFGEVLELCTLRNPAQETAVSAQFARGAPFLVLEFAVEIRQHLARAAVGIGQAPAPVPKSSTRITTQITTQPLKTTARLRAH
eukprot:2071770-Rhodomonas_salina.2